MPIVLKLLAIPVTAAVVLIGLWVTGALITNDFGVAMWLTIAWMHATVVVWCRAFSVLFARAPLR